jgi:hypothetical protein
MLNMLLLFDKWRYVLFAGQNVAVGSFIGIDGKYKKGCVCS